MGGKKRATWSKQKAEFAASLSGGNALDGLFAHEDHRHKKLHTDQEAHRRKKACESKNRYATKAEAEENRAWCEANGRRGLSVYRCPYCDGWHLTSHPWDA